MRLLDRFVGPRDSERSGYSMDWLAEQLMAFNGLTYPLGGYGRMSADPKEEGLDHSFTGYVNAAYKANGPVFALVTARMLLFAEISFTWRAVQDRKLFGTPDLALLENPAPGVTTQDMLASCEVDLSLAGNAYWTVRGAGPNRFLRRMRPDWVTIVSDGDEDDLDARVVGYMYWPGGTGSSYAPVPLLAAEVAHYTMTPDPLARFRGMSWLTPALRDIQADTGFTDYRTSFIQNGAVPSFVLKYPPLEQDKFNLAVKSFEEKYTGSSKFGRVLHTMGADPYPLSVDLTKLDFKNVQGGGESRLAAMARVPVTVAGFSEGNQGSSLNQGNYGQARRQFADGYAHPHWKSVCGAFAQLAPPPPASKLWYDTADVSFLREDQKDQAEVLNTLAQAIRTLWDGGAVPDSVVSAVTGNDLTLLKHSGKLSVQLQEPGAQPAAPARSMLVTGDELRALIGEGWTFPPSTNGDGSPSPAMAGR